MRVAPAATTRCRYDTYILAGLPLVPQVVAQLAAASCSGGSDTRTPGAPTTMAAICQGCLCFQCVTTSEIGIIERCGRYERLAPPGLRCVCWPLETVAGRVSRRIQQLDVACETKTSDNVFLNVIISVQYKVKEEYVYEAFYVLNDPSEQIKSYVYDVVRSTLPLLTLDKAFESKEMVAQSVKRELSGTCCIVLWLKEPRQNWRCVGVMSEYGFVIHNALVTDISPDGRVKTAMNEINASKRLKEAAFEKAEGVIYQCAKKLFRKKAPFLLPLILLGENIAGEIRRGPS